MVFCNRFASTFWKQLKRNNMVGSGYAQTVEKSATIDMLYHQDMF